MEVMNALLLLQFLSLKLTKCVAFHPELYVLDRHTFNGLFFQDNLGKAAPERLHQSVF